MAGYKQRVKCAAFSKFLRIWRCGIKKNCGWITAKQQEPTTTITGAKDPTHSRQQNRYNDADQRQTMLQEKDMVLQKSSHFILKIPLFS